MTGLDARLADTLASDPAAVPLLVGGCGTGRTVACLDLRERLGKGRAQYVDLERVATTPEHFLQSLIAHSPFLTAGGDLPDAPSSPRQAFDEALKYLATARTRDGHPATFLLDEVLEFRTFESFPGLREVLAELVHAVDDSPNGFVLTTRYATRGTRLAHSTSSRRLAPWVIAGVSPAAVLAHLRRICLEDSPPDPGDPELARLVHALAGGRPLYVDALARQMRGLTGDGACDPISALAAAISPGGRLDLECRYRYEMRLQRARGYGALRAILGVLAEEEPLTLTAISRRMQRTPGSTKDYLTWLGDVDLVTVDRKRYSFADPLLRLWVRLQARPNAPDAEDVAAEVHRYALEHLPLAETAPPARAGDDTGRGDAAAAPRQRAPREGEAQAAPVAARASRGQREWKDMEID
jgi:hypothetical protein